MIEIIPAIDIIDGRCVRLSQGDYSRSKVYDSTPAEMARIYAAAGVGRIHLVDLDGAKAGYPCNLDCLKGLASLKGVSLEWGGGIKDDSALEAVFSAGAAHAVVGSVAVKNPGLMRRWLERYGGERIILGADVREGKVAVSGWLEDSSLSIDDLIGSFLPYGLKECIVTDISRDGMLEGPSFELYESLSEKWPGVIFTVSGGISSMEDVRRLDGLGLPRVIVGKAIYEGVVSLEDIRLYHGRVSDNSKM